MFMCFNKGMVVDMSGWNADVRLLYWLFQLNNWCVFGAVEVLVCWIDVLWVLWLFDLVVITLVLCPGSIVDGLVRWVNEIKYFSDDILFCQKTFLAPGEAGAYLLLLYYFI